MFFVIIGLVVILKSTNALATVSGWKLALFTRSIFLSVFPDESEDMPHRASGAEMDEQRTKNIAYQYLCHLEEAKK